MGAARICSPLPAMMMSRGTLTQWATRMGQGCGRRRGAARTAWQESIAARSRRTSSTSCTIGNRSASRCRPSDGRCRIRSGAMGPWGGVRTWAEVASPGTHPPGAHDAISRRRPLCLSRPYCAAPRPAGSVMVCNDLQQEVQGRPIAFLESAHHGHSRCPSPVRTSLRDGPGKEPGGRESLTPGPSRWCLFDLIAGAYGGKYPGGTVSTSPGRGESRAWLRQPSGELTRAAGAEGRAGAGRESGADDERVQRHWLPWATAGANELHLNDERALLSSRPCSAAARSASPHRGRCGPASSPVTHIARDPGLNAHANWGGAPLAAFPSTRGGSARSAPHMARMGRGRSCARWRCTDPLPAFAGVPAAVPAVPSGLSAARSP